MFGLPGLLRSVVIHLLFGELLLFPKVLWKKLGAVDAEFMAF